MNEEKEFFDDAFDEAHSETVESETKEVIEQPQEDKESEAVEENKQSSEQVDVEESSDKKNDEDKILELEAELHSYKSRYKNSLSNLHKQANKVKIINNKAQEYIDNGVMTKEEAESLIEDINLDVGALPDTEEPVVTKDDNIIDKYYAVWKKAVPTIQEFMDVDPEHADAFAHLVKISTPQELEEIELEFSQYENNPIKLTKRMLELGKEHYEDVYKPLNDHGGYKGIQIAHKQEVAKYKKEIDKLNKELLKFKQNDDYIRNDKNSYTLPSTSKHNGVTSRVKAKDEWDSLVDDMYA
jgi:hypothetical protein